MVSCATRGTEDRFDCLRGRSLVVQISRTVDQLDAQDLAEMQQEMKDFSRHGPVLPTTEQAGCFEVSVERALVEVDPLPARLELSLQESSCGHVQDAFDAFALDNVARSGHAHGHWWRPDEDHIGLIWGSDFASGIMLTVAQREDGYVGLAAVVRDVPAATPDRTVIELRRVACPL